ncbi:BamA/TamA family outer membrane protein [Novosphingobium sp. RD2P27]|uniref:BamA/TamA family outer membrane protein n=1 Tax=Novosphingobium kalidii TaxID=3230299 RepID=A0ABV2CZ61_9SPHN
MQGVSVWLGSAGTTAVALALLSAPAHAQDAVLVDQPSAPAAVTEGLPNDSLRAGSVAIPEPPAEAPLPQVDPIIPDEEFNSAVPELSVDDDPELDRPLESIESFERRIAGQEADVAPTEGQALPAGDGALADQDPVEEIGDAPIRDAELAAPLPPLDQFEVAPVQFAEEEALGAEARVDYVVRLEGLDPADGSTDADLRDMFENLSALEKADGEAANVAMLSARLDEDAELLKTILASQGWYNAQVRTRLDQSAVAEGGAVAAVIEVAPGKRYTFADINIEAEPTVPPNLIAENLPLQVGNPIVAERVQAAEARVALALLQNGYPFAELGERDILLDQTTGDGVYTLPVDVGSRARFGGFNTEGDLAFGVEHIRTLARFEKGELYDSRKVDDLRKALIATGLFSTVSVEPKRTGEAAAEGAEYVTMLVRQDAGPPRTIAASAGYAAGQGFTLEATWTHRNMFPPEGALIVHGVAGTREQGAGVTFRRANAGRRDRTFEMIAEGLRSDYNAYNALTGRLAARVSYDSTQIWQKRVTYAYGAEVLGTAEREYDFSVGERRRRTFYIASLNGQLGYDTTDDLLNPTEGFRVTGLLQPEGSLQGDFTPYVRARLDASAYHPFGESFVLAGRVGFGTIQGAERSEIAPSRRFYSGGGGSVRGFGFQQLGPLDPNGDPIGGRSFNEGSVEGRYRFGNYGIVAFVDVGQSYASTKPKFSDLRYGIGIGGRFYTNFGPFRIDVATPLDRRAGESKINVYVSIGQAF